MIHIARNHQSLGSFNEESVREGLQSGRFSSGDLAWREGMAGWKPLGEMAPLWGLDASTPIPASEPAELMPGGGGEGLMPAWEERETLGILPSIARTVKAVLNRPSETFAGMKRTGGLAGPLLYFVMLSSAMFAVSVCYQIAATCLNPRVFPPQFDHAARGGYVVAVVGSILISPALYVVSAFLSSGVTHLCIMLVSGAIRPFETTFRVFCYAIASAAVMDVVPLFGSLVGMIWGGYCLIIGLREAHGIQGWKATLAVILPGLLCCGLILMLASIGLAEIARDSGGMPRLPKLP